MLVSSQQQNSFPQYQPMQMHIRPDYSQFQYMQPQPGMMASHMYTASASGSRDSIATGHDNLSGSAHMEGNFSPFQTSSVKLIIDTGASNHMIGDHTHLLDKKLIENAC
ncbi:hypothetical protein AABB24_004359 [Solanum stoloniferum]|uniref:Uncharacterized protein n=1 Tax=Solanum stoloniferum TaxID=62892 RepID=A0ABD2VC34_9SOLN